MEIRSLVSEAWRVGSQFDLSGIGYGRIHWGNRTDIDSEVQPYYHFLAGMVRVLRAKRIIEIGTHQGGSARAMAAGLFDPENSRVVTFDPNPFAANLFTGHPVIRAYALDGNSETAIRMCRDDLGGMNADMTFIDSTHDFPSTLHSWLLYAELIRTPVIVLDDVTLNDSMRSLWSLIRERYAYSIDATEVEPGIRPCGDARPGFGVVLTQQ